MHPLVMIAGQGRQEIALRAGGCVHVRAQVNMAEGVMPLTVLCIATPRLARDMLRREGAFEGARRFPDASASPEHVTLSLRLKRSAPSLHHTSPQALC